LDIYWNILTMQGPINVKSPNNTGKWQIGFCSAFKGLISVLLFVLQQPRSTHLVMINKEDEIRNHYNNSNAKTSKEGKSDNVHLILVGMTGTRNRY
jgi:hypothetical protein